MSRSAQSRKLLVHVLAGCCLTIAPAIAKPTYATFTISGATALYTSGLNDEGVVVGVYDAKHDYHHGYLRLSDGTIILFNPLGSQLTQPLGINNNGDITGYFYDGTTYHAFLRTFDGNIATVDPPGAQRATAQGINNNGAITGEIEEPEEHGFLRMSDGSFTIFDVPGAAQTTPEGINDRNDITGFYYNSDKHLGHGFIRAGDGTFTTFDVAGSNITTTPLYISNNGTVIGFYGPNTQATPGFIRTPSGKIKTFTFPKALGVVPGNMNNSGWFTGFFYGSGRHHTGGPPHAFLAKSINRIKTFKAPDCEHTFATRINSGGDVAGGCSEKPMGFIRKP